MTDTNTKPASKMPTYIAHHVRGEGEEAFWTRIGAAWEHKDKKGLNIQLDIFPLDGRITLRVPSEKPE